MIPHPVIPTANTPAASDIETTTTRTISTATQSAVDKIQGLCTEKIQAFLDPFSVYTHLLAYLQQINGGGTLNLSSQQVSICQTLVSEAVSKKLMGTADAAAILAAIK